MATHTNAGYTEVHCCRICRNPNLVPILDLGIQALTGVFPRSTGDPVPRSPLELVKCLPVGDSKSCGLVQLRHSYSLSEMYGDNYGYRSGLNAAMVAHLRRKAQRIKETIQLAPGDLVLDIGSNDSTFLQAMREEGITAVGMDPSGSKFRSYYPSDIALIPEFFSARGFNDAFEGRRASVVTSFAMFYDLEDPVQFMREIEEVLTDDGIWVFEQSYLPLMLARNAYDTVCHEHLEYYALGQIVFMAEQAGLKILDVETNDVNGGSFSVVAAKRASTRPANHGAIERLQREESEIGIEGLKVFREFENRVGNLRQELRQFLACSREDKLKLFGYGASTKGNVILQYCNVTTAEIACIADVNRDKYGAFTPGTHIPIVSEEDARSQCPDAWLVLPWHFRPGILRREEPFLRAGHKIVFPLPRLDVVSIA
jgi:NDP-4-keto-2,6-dideoxyhexose 3-C-methyltransferase